MCVLQLGYSCSKPLKVRCDGCDTLARVSHVNVVPIANTHSPTPTNAGTNCVFGKSPLHQSPKQTMTRRPRRQQISPGSSHD